MHHRSLRLACACALVTLATLAAHAQAAPSASRLSPVADALAAGDPLAFDAKRAPELERSAASGHSHVLYQRTPNGVAEAARRTAAFRRLVERAVEGSGFSPDVVEAMVFLESAGRPTARAGDDPAAASGLTQILGGTAVDFLDMRVNLYASKLLTRRIVTALGRGQYARARRLAARRAQVDERFAPAKALAATVRYLTRAREYLGRNDLAVVSYHMGIGNLQNAVRAYAGAPAGADTAALVREHDVSYARLYFDSAPDRHPAAWALLSGLSDDSLNYYWKVLAARRIMHLYRRDQAQLGALVRLHAAKLSAEEVLHPPSRTPVFSRSTAVVAARRRGTLLPLPTAEERLHVGIAGEAGEMARRLGRSPNVYRALRPEAVALLLYLGQRVHQLSGVTTPLLVTSAVRDEVYQRVLMRRNVMAARVYSLHTTGYAFDIARDWASPGHAAAVQFVLDRLVAHGLVAYIKEPTAIHIAVSKDAGRLVPAMLGAPPEAPLGGIGDAVQTELPVAPGPAATPVGAPEAVESKSWFDEFRERIGF